MSAENVEIVRRHYETLDRGLASYWENPGPLAKNEELGAVLDALAPDAEWDWFFSPEVFKGRAQLIEAANDFIDSVEGWRIELEEVVDAGDDKVFAVMVGRASGRGSGAPADQRIYSVVTVRDGRIVRLKDHTDRAEALAAAGLT